MDAGRPALADPRWVETLGRCAGRGRFRDARPRRCYRPITASFHPRRDRAGIDAGGVSRVARRAGQHAGGLPAASRMVGRSVAGIWVFDCGGTGVKNSLEAPCLNPSPGPSPKRGGEKANTPRRRTRLLPPPLRGGAGGGVMAPNAKSQRKVLAANMVK